MHRFTFDDSRFKEIRNKGFLRGLAVLAGFFLYYLIKSGPDIIFNTSFDFTTAIIIMVVWIVIEFLSNKRERKVYNQIKIVIDDDSITHIQPDEDDATLLFKDIKSITQNKQGLFIQSIYPASSLKVLAQMQGYNQIVELLSAVKPIKKQGILNRIFLLNVGWVATVILAVIFKNFILDNGLILNAVFLAGIVLVCTRFYNLQTSPYVNKDDKWASYGLVVIAILLLAILVARIAKGL